uniref:Mitochondrial antiviral-signaling protein n=1 Tax=Mola mola TaxID=94237 RepID=A0A3Q3XM01_MOLML
MTFASDKLFNGYLRRNMPTIVSKVKVREIIPHLPCLTGHDMETIEAKRETCGNYDGMVLLLDCLKRRENWPEEFILALEQCGHQTIADGIRNEYDNLRCINSKSAAVTLPAEASAPLEPAAQASPSLEIPEHPVSQDAPLPEPVSEPAQIEVAPAPSTPPPSPETIRTQPASASPPPQGEIIYHQEPVENSESDIQDVSGDGDVSPDQVSAGNVVDTPQPAGPVEQCEKDTKPQLEALQRTTPMEVRPPRSPSPTETNSDMTDRSAVNMMTPEKPPVQDTNPSADSNSAAVLQPEETSEPPAAQVVESSPKAETAATTFPLLDTASMGPSLFDSTLCLSKPGELISTQPQNHDSPTVCAPILPGQPYSGNTARLEMSIAAATSAHVSACSAATSTTVNTTSVLPCQENGIALDPGEPEENHYDSPLQSLGTQEVRVNVVQISEEPSILNLDGQSSAPQAQIFNGEAAKENSPAAPLSNSAADTVLSVNAPTGENYHPFEPAPADLSQELKLLQDSEKTSSHTLATNTMYILTAAGVGACALLMAWKFKN